MTVTASQKDDRYTIISADCHAGGRHDDYRAYLESAYLERFDAWRSRYKNPFRDLQDDRRSRNWDNDRRIREQEADGVVAEVIFPNTVPPFFPTGQIVAPAPSTEDFELRLAGLRAHNRWLADFALAAPGRRAGLAQVLLNDVQQAVIDVRWAKDHGLAGVLLPGVAPDSDIEPLFSPVYDPLWAVCQELAMPVTHHSGGSGIPSYGQYPASTLIFIMETSFFANRALWHLVMSGVFERFPQLVFVMTEQGSGWIPDVLDRMDALLAQTKSGRIGELHAPAAQLTLKPSEYFRRNCFVGASFPNPREAALFDKIGIDRVMWGSDYPHDEGTLPYTRQALRRSFAAWDPDALRKVLAHNVAGVYGFDLAALAPIAAAHGPTVEEISVPLEHIPADSNSPAFARR